MLTLRGTNEDPNLFAIVVSINNARRNNHGGDHENGPELDAGGEVHCI
jgi:hypothetical protein